MTNITVPVLGESVSEATVATWFVKIGDSIAQDQVLCELETDKVTVEVPAQSAGVLKSIAVQEGDTVAVGAILGEIDENGVAVAPAASTPKAAPAQNAPQETTSAAPSSSKDVENAPSANLLMAQNNIAASLVTGSGRDGRIMKDDVLNAMNNLQNSTPSTPAAPRADNPREERIKMTKLRQTIARRLKESQNTAAMLTTYNEVDMSGIMNLRNTYKEQFEKKHGVKLGFMSFFVKACAHALFEIPEVNAEIDGTDIIYKNYVNMGVAVGTPNGLVVPVVRNAHEKSFATIEKEIADFGRRARDGKLSMDEMSGGSFTISNGGVYGSLMSSPILNPPQSGILGMHKIQERVMVEKGEMVIRPMMYLALSYDHRIVDGKGAVTFLVRVKEALEDPRRLLMDL